MVGQIATEKTGHGDDKDTTHPDAQVNQVPPETSKKPDPEVAHHLAAIRIRVYLAELENYSHPTKEEREEALKNLAIEIKKDPAAAREAREYLKKEAMRYEKMNLEDLRNLRKAMQDAGVAESQGTSTVAPGAKPSPSTETHR